MNKTVVSVPAILNFPFAPRTSYSRMPGRFRPIAFFIVFVFCLFAMAAHSFAAEKVQGRILSVGIGGALGNVDQPPGGGHPLIDGRAGTYRAGTWVPVLVELKNISGEPRKVRLSASADDLDNDTLTTYSASITLPAEAKEHNVWFYYWPSPKDNEIGNGISSIAIRGDDDATRGEIVGTATIQYFKPREQLTSKEVTALFPASTGFTHPQGNIAKAWRNVVILGKGNQGWFNFHWSMGQNAAIHSVNVQDALNLPSNVMGFEGVDILVWNTNEIRVSSVQEGFQRKAIIDWVRAGGHLILIAPSAFAELNDLDANGVDLLPAVPESYKPLPQKDVLAAYFAQFAFSGFKKKRTPHGTLVEEDNPYYPNLILPEGDIFSVVSKPKPDAHGILAKDINTPLAYVRPYGAGFVTLLSVNVNDPVFAPIKAGIGPSHWVAFWSRIAGFQGEVASLHEITNQASVNPNDKISPAPGLSKAGWDIPTLLDVASVTQNRLLFSVLFLIAYWIIAGPGGHAVLKAYKKVYWSWWTFGFVVVVATVAAIGAAYFLRITYETIRHHSFVIGTADSSEVVIKGYYGVLTPSSGNVRLELPETTGISYIVPLYPFTKESSGFSPRQYVTYNDLNGQPIKDEKGKIPGSSIEIPFRRTLKRVEARWHGTLESPLISGSLQRTKYSSSGPIPIRNRDNPGFGGVLKNNTGQTLKNVSIVYSAQTDPKSGDSETRMLDEAEIAYYAPTWHPGTELIFDKFEIKMRLPQALYNIARSYRAESTTNIASWGTDETQVWEDFRKYYESDLLNLFADANHAGSPQQQGQVDSKFIHVGRPYTRALDRTNVLRTLGAVLIAEIGSDKDENAPPSFLPITVDKQKVESHGKTILAIGIKLNPYVPPPKVTTTTSRPATTSMPATNPATK